MATNDVLNERLNALHGDLSEVKSALAQLSEAITKLALVEERQSQTASALERAFKTIDKIEQRVSAIEQANVKHSSTSIWVDRAISAAVAMAALIILQSFGVGV